MEKRLTALEEAEFEDELDVGKGNAYESWKGKGKERDRSGEEEVEREMGMQCMLFSFQLRVPTMMSAGLMIL